jgi:hypothetical protein
VFVVHEVIKHGERIVHGDWEAVLGDFAVVCEQQMNFDWLNFTRDLVAKARRESNI